MTSIMPITGEPIKPDPSNSDPSAWTEELTDDEVLEAYALVEQEVEKLP